MTVGLGQGRAVEAIGDFINQSPGCRQGAILAPDAAWLRVTNSGGSRPLNILDRTATGGSPRSRPRGRACVRPSGDRSCGHGRSHGGHDTGCCCHGAAEVAAASRQTRRRSKRSRKSRESRESWESLESLRSRRSQPVMALAAAAAEAATESR